MHKTAIASLLALASSLALAQMPEDIQRSSSPRGMQIQGNTQINASAQNTNAAAVGKDNTAKNAVGAVKDSVQIQGNTRINATGINTNAVAVGKGNKADNTVGSIGGQ